MKIAVGSDHVGYSLKQVLASYLRNKGYEVIDTGPVTDTRPVDYPDFARKVALLVASGVCWRGVVVCGTGVGVSIAANKIPGVRAVLCDNLFIARQSRFHNDTNVIAFGAHVVTPQVAQQCLDVWLETSFEGDRHIPRLAKLDLAFQESWESALGDLASLDRANLQIGIALSPTRTVFAPLVFAGELERGVEAAAQAGFDGIEISLRAPEDLRAADFQQLIKRYGLRLAAIATGQSCLKEGLCLTLASDDAYSHLMKRLKTFIDIAAEFGSLVIIGGVRGQLRGSEAERQLQRQRVVASLTELAQYAQLHGVSLVLEPINRYETNFINTTEEALRFLEEMGVDHLRLLLDTFHLNIEERDITQSILKAGGKIGYMHFADNNRLAPGQGHINYVNVLKALITTGYRGFITAEILPLPDDKTALQQAAGFMRALLDRS
jgi:ribose 5-phosphate isomerase B